MTAAIKAYGSVLCAEMIVLFFHINFFCFEKNKILLFTYLKYFLFEYTENFPYEIEPKSVSEVQTEKKEFQFKN